MAGGGWVNFGCCWRWQICIFAVVVGCEGGGVVVGCERWWLLGFVIFVFCFSFCNNGLFLKDILMCCNDKIEDVM